MARPNKTGLEYFSFDVDFFEDEKIIPISIEFGSKGEIVAIRLLCAIYRNGYFAKWDVPLKMKIAKNSGLSPDLIESVVRGLVKWEFFDKDLFNSFSILSSKGIQKRYLESTKRRVNVKLDSYCLLNDNRNPENIDRNPKNVDNNQQSKVKESKVKESKEGESCDKVIDNDPVQTILTPAFFSLFDSEFPRVDHLREFRKCYDYYNSRNGSINNWESLYRNWLNKDYPKVLKPVKPAPRRPSIPLEEIAPPEVIQEEIRKARNMLKGGNSD